MERLSGLDAGFLYFETPTLLMHTLKLLLLDRPPQPLDVRAMLMAATRSRLHSLPMLRRRLIEVPFGLHHPLWMETTEIDLERHILTARIDAPGDARATDEAIAKIASSPLDRSRPLWELWVLEGRADGAIAVLLKIHHSLADGAAAAHLISTVTSSDPLELPRLELSDNGTPERMPSKTELLVSAVRDRAHDLVALPALALRTAKSVSSVLRAHPVPRPPWPMLDAPRTSFNGALSARRSLATVSLSLARVHGVKAAAKVTLNDVVLALVSGSLRRYLIDRGELPHRPLIASVPISSEPEKSRRLTGNRVSSLFTTLATDLVDPGERLAAIHAVTREAKHVDETLGADLMAAWLQYGMPLPISWAMTKWSKWRCADLVPAPLNVVISNVHGPERALFAGDLPVRAIYSVGPVLEGIGLNVTVWSYLEKLHFAVLACREMVPNPYDIASLFEGALEELEASVPGALAHPEVESRALWG